MTFYQCGPFGRVGAPALGAGFFYSKFLVERSLGERRSAFRRAALNVRPISATIRTRLRDESRCLDDAG